jgi:hypothetical protein
VLAAERLYGDDTTVPILAKGKTVTGGGRLYVRDDRPFGGTAPPAALYYASDRTLSFCSSGQRRRRSTPIRTCCRRSPSFSQIRE